jgi:hypothetical protein
VVCRHRAEGEAGDRFTSNGSAHLKSA